LYQHITAEVYTYQRYLYLRTPSRSSSLAVLAFRRIRYNPNSVAKIIPPAAKEDKIIPPGRNIGASRLGKKYDP
jgi:hypothetical protein